MQSNTQTSGIHCKVATQDQVRRFLLQKVQYNFLLEQVCQLFGFSKDSVVIKYADDEKDMVTISSDEELRFAVELAQQSILHLQVELIKGTASLVPISLPVPVVKIGVDVPVEANLDEDSEDSDSARENKQWRKKNSKRCLDNPIGIQNGILRLKNKREKLQTRLVFLDAAVENGQLGKSQARHRDKIREKLTFIDTRLERLSEALARVSLSPVTDSLPTLTACTSTSTPPAPLSTSIPATESTPSVPLPTTSPAKEELLRQLDDAQNMVTSVRLALRQACLQMQLQRANLQAAMHNGDLANVGTVPSKEQVEQMKADLKVAKDNQVAKKVELQTHCARLNNLRHQLKEIKHQEKAQFKFTKHQCKRHQYNTEDDSENNYHRRYRHQHEFQDQKKNKCKEYKLAKKAEKMAHKCEKQEHVVVPNNTQQQYFAL